MSVWELSVDSSPGVKADKDYEKRDSTPDGSPTQDATYVQLILRAWTDRTNWSTGRKKDGTWKDVRAFGLDDVQTWLESAPVTWAWFSEQVGLQPYGMRTASTWWEAWAQQTSPPATPDLVLSGRSATISAIHDRISRPGIATLAGASLDEVCAVLAAVAASAESAGDSSVVSRLLFVEDLAAWRQLLDSPVPLILVPTNPDFAREVPSGCPHTVLVPVSGLAGADIQLPPLDAHGVAAALGAAGMGDQRKCEELGRLARRSLTALRRNLASNIALHSPQWAKAPLPRHIRAALLAGGWSGTVEGDKSVLEELSGDQFGTFQENVAALALSGDPMLVKSGNAWQLVSPFDTWLLLAEHLDLDDLTRLQSVVAKVFGEEDPALEIPEEERWWRASYEGKVRAFSPVLRRGLAASIALLGVRGDSVSLPGGASGGDWANSLVRAILQHANDDKQGRIWASLSDLLPLLAEGGPAAFLDAVKLGLSTDHPTLVTMFTDKKDRGPFGSSSPHVGLLWALETLAWSPHHFGAVVDALARLAEIDPGGRLANRPFDSLAAIFCPWHPETSVNTTRRLAVIDRLRKMHNPIAWKLMMSVLPSRGQIRSAASEPSYRDWKRPQYPVNTAEYLTFVSEIIQSCVVEAGADASRWQELIGHYSELPSDDRDTVLTGLASVVGRDQLSADDRTALWNALRKMVAMHREYSDAKWALPTSALAKLDDVIRQLQPTDAYDQYQWLFQDHLPPLDDVARRGNHDEYQELLAERRSDAIAAIEEEGGLERVRELAQNVEVSAAVGTALAEACPTYDDALLALLTTDDRTGVELAMQYYTRRFRQGGWVWLENFVKAHQDATDLQQARLLLASGDFPKAWELADRYGDGVAELFWRHFSPYGLGRLEEGRELIAQRLMSVGRNAAALHFIRIYFRDATDGDLVLAELIAQGLEGILNSPNDNELGALRDYDISEFFEILEAVEDSLGTDRIASLEWNFLPALGHEPEVRALQKLMAEDPQFFVEVVRAAYSPVVPDDSDGSDEERSQSEARARNGFKLLSAWEHTPGLTDGRVDAERLESWFASVSEILGEEDRVGAALTHVGQVLAYSPDDPDGVWPPEVVRDFVEEHWSDKLENGLMIAILNKRGVTSRGLEEGGGQEERLAQDFRKQADEFADQWPRISAMFRSISDSYAADARRNEESAERFRKGLE
ncbi:hypothetical protein [Mycolicibacterium fortuitum]|uniref:hypothetical protein n=2 Tax=Mycolicibacterium fortuitum TaxID=1766 RepID=UPI001041C335|nr:hypothetical protein [Mycolicibacterium fortuitum]